MDLQHAIQVATEYYNLCKKHNLKFGWNIEGLIKNPENIKVALFEKKINEIKSDKETSNKKPKVAKKKKGSPKKGKREPKKKKTEIHITVKKLKKSEQAEEIKKQNKKTVGKKKKGKLKK